MGKIFCFLSISYRNSLPFCLHSVSIAVPKPPRRVGVLQITEKMCNFVT